MHVRTTAMSTELPKSCYSTERQPCVPLHPCLHTPIRKSKGDTDNKQLAHSNFVLHVNRDKFCCPYSVFINATSSALGRGETHGTLHYICLSISDVSI